MSQLEARVDLLERTCAELIDENRRLKRDVTAAVDQAKYAIRKLDQVRTALTDEVPVPRKGEAAAAVKPAKPVAAPTPLESDVVRMKRNGILPMNIAQNLNVPLEDVKVILRKRGLIG